MIIYNVTVNVEEEVHLDWIKWMKEVHIPEVMETGYFLENKIAKVITTQEDETGHTYAIQYSCNSMADLDEYQEKCATPLQEAHGKRYQGKFVAFRTLLEVV
ncbi:MAG: DUF4286 family protein [Flavobacteriales bacterium]|nr:DUF4286 family protein [Flavobacteriales bacterium]NQX96560.1 DUF4286 family protein [Flavobacteriales bacterium]